MVIAVIKQLQLLSGMNIAIVWTNLISSQTV